MCIRDRDDAGREQNSNARQYRDGLEIGEKNESRKTMEKCGVVSVTGFNCNNQYHTLCGDMVCIL